MSSTARAIDSVQYHATWLFMSLGVGALALLMSVQPDGEGVSLPLVGRLPELCMLKSNTGLDCPGCGLTRSFIALAGGDVESAWHYNPVGLLMFGILLYQIPYRLIALGCLARGKTLSGHSTRLSSAVIFIVVGGLFAQWLWKFLQ